ncbi:DEAD/DEAH box helicase, partial [bacterium]|nr:DEAD/DEAH box helicase [bacterium]
MILPIDEFLPQITATIKNHKNMIIMASPGAGKTTRLPVALTHEMKRQIWVLEPRRIAAMAAAYRIAEENNWKVGEEVGYQIRFASVQSKKTKILFLTEALLLKKLKTDTDLQNVDAVILDEFHERSIHIDLALAALKELQDLSRPDLKIIVMSATLNAQSLAKYLDDAPTIDVPGKIFPQQMIYDEKQQVLRTGPDLIDRMQQLVLKAIKQNPQGDVLCFLPGRGEIARLHSKLSESLSMDYKVVPLHGQLSMTEQKETLEPSNQRKIVLATNIAESALTIDGVRIVVDSGLVRQSSQNLRTGFESLQLVKISKASATQRAGRSARQGPGVVYRAWTKHEESSQKEYDSPEISRVDLSETLLLLANLGITHFEQFSWFEKPSELQLKTAENFLINIGALERPIRLTWMGQQMAELPLHPRLAKLLILGEQKGCLSLACKMAALLSEGKWKSSTGEENDLSINDPLSSSAKQMVQQLMNLMSQNKNVSETKESSRTLESVAELLFETYPDRLCRRRKKSHPEAKMVGGRGVEIHSQSSVKSSEYFLALEVADHSNSAQNAIVFSAFGLSNEFVEEKLLHKCKAYSSVAWDEETQKFWTTKG